MKKFHELWEIAVLMSIFMITADYSYQHHILHKPQIVINLKEKVENLYMYEEVSNNEQQLFCILQWFMNI